MTLDIIIPAPPGLLADLNTTPVQTIHILAFEYTDMGWLPLTFDYYHQQLSRPRHPITTLYTRS